MLIKLHGLNTLDYDLTKSILNFLIAGQEKSHDYDLALKMSLILEELQLECLDDETKNYTQAVLQQLEQDIQIAHYI